MPMGSTCVWFGFAAVLTMTVGTVFLMWIGEQIDEYGIGNGISLIIMAGIVARIPDATGSLLIDSTTGKLKESVFTLGGATGDISFEKTPGAGLPVPGRGGRRDRDDQGAAAHPDADRPSTFAAAGSTAEPGSSCP